jgi:hypothetical protein
VWAYSILRRQYQYTKTLKAAISAGRKHLVGTKHKIPLKMTVFWCVAPCNLVEIGGRFRGAAFIISEIA